MKTSLAKKLAVIACATPVLAFAQPPRNFDGLTCQSSIEHDLVGRQMSNEPVVKIEARYKSLDLKDDGADEISDQLNAIFWHICGDQYVLLMKKDRVQTALKVPEQYRAKDLIPCEPTDKTRKGYIIAVPGKPGAKSIHADAAWVLDEKQGRFVTLDSTKLECEGGPGM